MALLKGEFFKGPSVTEIPMILELPRVDSTPPALPVGKAKFDRFVMGVSWYTYSAPDGTKYAISRDPANDKVFRGVPLAWYRDCMNALNRT